MPKTLLLLLTTSLLLVGCSSDYKEMCARLAALDITTQEGYKRLGLKDLGGDMDRGGLHKDTYGHSFRTGAFCRYYQESQGI